ncbi:beta-glucosidase 2 [Colletotrichum karsti]|uniref:Beta-glucosidase cel3A n=1 Tax=Colletotrichum karsti TaxID=1095194 RepID=A0A9P6LMA5_9PEZI|nr:beta-glucosidase 2 [Colletotrichum karsti]KAF9878011.1 beta-glucosidase 2 [Colletotrichum karsti]
MVSLKLLSVVTSFAVASVGSTSFDRDIEKWNEAVEKADVLTTKLNLTEKATFVTGKLALGTAPCIGNILPIDHAGFKGICMQDGPNGINIADLVSVFPAGLTTAASWDKALMLERAKAIGKEFRGKGINIALGPSAGPMGRHPLGGRNWEGSSIDPYLSGVAMEQTVRGIQSMGVQTCSKHFLANEQELQRSYTIVNGQRIEGISSNVGDRAVHELYGWPFYNAIRAGTTSIMCSYNRFNGTYACENEYLMEQVLRKEMGFDGYIMSDWFATHSGAKSINAGLDLNMPGGYDEATIQTGESYWGSVNITAMIEEGSVKEERIDEMVRRILTAYYYLDQDTEEYPETDWSLMYTFVAWSNVLDLFPPPYPESRDVRQDHGDLIRRIAAESTVLLKNDGILPLKSLKNIGVFGNDAADPTDGLTFNNKFEIGTLDVGSGAASGRHTYLVSPLEAIKARAKETGARVQYMLRNSVIAQGDFSASYPIPDVCLVFLNAFSGENKDRTSWELDWNSTAVVGQVADRCNDTIVVTHSVGPNTMPWANHSNVKAILVAHLPGQETGNSIVDVLWGDVNPSGRLPYSIPVNSSDIDIPIVNLTNATSPGAWQADFDEGLLVDYRHLEENGIEPLFGFGFGLSYTTFNMSDELAITQVITNLTSEPDPTVPVIPGGHPDLWETVVTVGVSVTNTGSVAGAIVPQLYVSLPPETSPAGTPVKVLRGFDKVFLESGESKGVIFNLTRRDLSYYNTSRRTWTIPEGALVFRVGFDSRDIKATGQTVLLEN